MASLDIVKLSMHLCYWANGLWNDARLGRRSFGRRVDTGCYRSSVLRIAWRWCWGSWGWVDITVRYPVDAFDRHLPQLGNCPLEEAGTTAAAACRHFCRFLTHFNVDPVSVVSHASVNLIFRLLFLLCWWPEIRLDIFNLLPLLFFIDFTNRKKKIRQLSFTTFYDQTNWKSYQIPTVSLK